MSKTQGAIRENDGREAATEDPRRSGNSFAGPLS